jgi:hypothetical protein
MGRAKSRNAVTTTLSTVVLGLGLAACSSHRSGLPTVPTTGATAAQGNTAAAQGGGGGSNAANPGGGSAAAATDTVLGGGKGCALLSASDVTNAVGIPLPSMLGSVNGGIEGNTAHDSCLWTKDSTGTGADVSVEINTFASGVSTQLATQRKNNQDQADSANQLAANSASVKDAAVGDAGYEIDYTDPADETVWFTKGSKLISVEVNKGHPGAALTLAKLVAGKE